MSVPDAPAGRSTPAATGTPLTKRRAVTQARLLEAAAALFAERGFGRATVEDICERAGYTRGAFYSNFATLDELFFALYAARATDLARRVADVVDAATADTTPMDLTAVMDRVVAALPVTREHHLLNLEFTAHALRFPAVAEALARHRLDLRLALLPIVALGLRNAGIAVDDDELDRIGRAVIAVNEGMSTQELLEPGDPTLPALRRDLLSTVVSRHR